MPSRRAAWGVVRKLSILSLLVFLLGFEPHRETWLKLFVLFFDFEKHGAQFADGHILVFQVEQYFA